MVGSGKLSSEEIEVISHKVENDVHSYGMRGIRSLAVAKTNENGEWEMLGMLTFLDPPRPDTKQTIEDAHKYGVAVKMITGTSSFMRYFSLSASLSFSFSVFFSLSLSR